SGAPLDFHSFPTRRSSDLDGLAVREFKVVLRGLQIVLGVGPGAEVQRLRSRNAQPSPLLPGRLEPADIRAIAVFLRRAEREDHRSEEHTSELQSRFDLVCR